jgi:hypothetical protein
MEAIVDPPIALVETKYIVKYRYYLYNLILNEQVTIIIDYTNSEQRQIYQSIITLTGEQYAAWGQDDSYIQNIVLAEVDKLRNNGAFVTEVLPVIAPVASPEPVVAAVVPVVETPVDNVVV